MAGGNGCCGSAAYGVVIDAGPHIEVTGIGSAQDPYVISGDFDFAVADNTTFDLDITGSGTEAEPYVLRVAFASTASVKDFPDWSDNVPSNGQVPVWNSTLGRYVPGSPTPAASGSVSHDTSLVGDGSSGSPLAVVHDPSGYTGTSAPGVGLTAAGINSLNRRFPNSAARTAASPAPASNTLSALDSAPGLIDVWDGSGWVPVEGQPTVVGGQLLALSGPYAGGRVRRLVKQVALTTQADGTFALLNSSDFGSAAGVLAVTVQPTGSVMYACLVTASPGSVQGTAYRLDTGGVFGSQPIQAVVTAILY
jgi:hypothetical protein